MGARRAREKSRCGLEVDARRAATHRTARERTTAGEIGFTANVGTSPMRAHPPPVPPEQRSPFAGDAAHNTADEKQGNRGTQRDRNLAEQGRQGNIKQNTTNQGYQQDR
jgi:hypothetical protein